MIKPVFNLTAVSAEDYARRCDEIGITRKLDTNYEIPARISNPPVYPNFRTLFIDLNRQRKYLLFAYPLGQPEGLSGARKRFERSGVVKSLEETLEMTDEDGFLIVEYKSYETDERERFFFKGFKTQDPYRRVFCLKASVPRAIIESGYTHDLSPHQYRPSHKLTHILQQSRKTNISIAALNFSNIPPLQIPRDETPDLSDDENRQVKIEVPPI